MGSKVGLLIPAAEAKTWQHVKCESGNMSNAKEMVILSWAQLTGKTSDLLPLTRSNIIDKLKPEQNGTLLPGDVIFKYKNKNAFCSQ